MSYSDQSFAQEAAEIATVHSSEKKPKQENYLASTTSSTIFLQSIFLQSIFLQPIFLLHSLEASTQKPAATVPPSIVAS